MDASKRIFTENWQAYNDGVRVVANKGGTRSGKTFSILIVLFKIALSADKPLLVSVVSESYRHIKRGAMRDFAKLVDSTGIKEGKHYTHSRTDHLYTFSGGGQIEFFGIDSPGKVHGAQRDILFINECNHIDWEIYRQLAVRTAGTIFLDWNPTTRFWFEDKGVETQPTTRVVHSTYLDNPFLPDGQIAEIESHKDDANWWKVYGLGQTGSVEGIIFTNWDVVTSVPQASRVYYGIDFGYSVDPTAILRVSQCPEGIFVECLAYDTKMDNPDIASLLVRCGCNSATDIVADNQEPKSIAEINNAGNLNAKPVVKGADSIRYGISVTQRHRLHILADAVELIDELRRYMWKQDKDGKWLDTPTGKPDHAIDALRYVMMTYFDIQPTGMPRQSRGRRLW